MLARTVHNVMLVAAAMAATNSVAQQGFELDPAFQTIDPEAKY
jgi:hypothetical protein